MLPLRAERGFSLLDVLAVAGLVGVVMAITVPTVTGAIERMRLGQSAREVERELQWAKSRAVGKGRPIRVRFNCPGPGEYRAVELIGSPAAPVPADNAPNRCDPTAYPYPARDNDPMTRPNLDGPVKWVDSSVRFGLSQVIEFWPDGTAHYNGGSAGNWPMIPTSGISIRLDRADRSATIRVNGLGKITLETH